MKIPASQRTVRLTHYGRKSGKAFDVTVWFTEIDGQLWIGSLDANRSWVRNLRATGRARVDFGAGAEDVVAEFVENEADQTRYRAAVAAKYPVLSRIVAMFVRGKTRGVFRLTPAAGATH